MKAVFLLICFIISSFLSAQTKQYDPASYFKEIRDETRKHTSLWDIDLYGPILLVDPETRQLFANEPDSAGSLQPIESGYSGILPKDVNIANTSIRWNGRNWAMILLPLSADKNDRINLMAHELFHVSQPSLGFQLFNSENNHLDKKEGRIYLRLELEALKKALLSSSNAEMKEHLTNAMIYRQFRYMIYPEADKTENLLELNEGLAEYTGSEISGRSKKLTLEHFLKSIDDFMNNPTFVRSFAYQTIPVYGYLVKKFKKNWNKNITLNSNLTEYFRKAFELDLPMDIRDKADRLIKLYNGEKIISEEAAREERTLAQIASYKDKFITQPHLEIRFEMMNVSFDPRNIVPVEDKGTVYPNIRVTDNWGILTVENGALMGANWDRISVSLPLKTEGNLVTGDGWTIEVKEGYSLVKDNLTGNYTLIKK
ncbi:hypothetical protein BH10BAC5_BH10BAC5_13410 [soil metagenome]